MSLCCANSLNHVGKDVVRIGFINDFNKTSRCDLDRCFAFQAEKYIIGTFTAAFRNALSKKFSPAFHRNDRDTRVKHFSIGDHTSRNVYDGRRTIRDRRETIFGQSVEETMGAPMQGKIPGALGGLKFLGRECVMVFRIDMRNPRNNAPWKDESRFISKLRTRKANQRVFAASRWSNDKNQRTFI